LVALGLQDGRGLWEAAVALPKGRSELERMVDIDADPVLFGDTLYVAAFQGRVVAVDAESGQLRWSREISSIAGLGVDRDHVYVTDEDSVVWGLDRSTGSALWRQEALRSRALTAPTPYGDAVLVGDLEGYLHALARDDGRLLGRVRLDSSPVLAAPVSQGAVLYAASSGGTVTALRD
jgi:outer membrane protein assembly factor BamB